MEQTPVPENYPDVFILRPEISGQLADQSYEQTRAELRKIQLNPPLNDIRLSALCKAANELLDQRPGFRSIVRYLSARHKVGLQDLGGMPPSGAAGILRYMAVSHALKRVPDFTDPAAGYDQPAAWKREFIEVEQLLMENDSPEAEALAISITTGMAKTNVGARGIPYELFLQTIRRRYPNNARSLHVGSSIMVVENQILRKAEFPYPRTGLVDQHGHPLPDLTEKANRLLALPSPLDSIVCVDSERVYNNRAGHYTDAAVGEAKAWRKPGELADKKALLEDAELSSVKANGIEFIWADFADPKSMEEHFDPSYQDSKFPIVAILTVLENVAPTERKAIMREALHRVTDDGVIWVQGHVFPNGQKPAHFKTFQNWHEKGRNKYISYCMFAEDDFLRQEVFAASDSRISQLALGQGRYPVTPGNYLTPAEAILAA